MILFVFSGLCISSCTLAHTDTGRQHTDRQTYGSRQNDTMIVLGSLETRE